MEDLRFRIYGRFDSMVPPFHATFWRMQPEARLRHHSPLMDIEGVGMGSFAIDILHTWHLGPLLKYIPKVFWTLIRADVWGDAPPWLYTEDKLHLNLVHLRTELWVYYKQKAKDDPEWSTRASQVLLLQLSTFLNIK